METPLLLTDTAWLYALPSPETPSSIKTLAGVGLGILPQVLTLSNLRRVHHDDAKRALRHFNGYLGADGLDALHEEGFDPKHNLAIDLLLQLMEMIPYEHEVGIQKTLLQLPKGVISDYLPHTDGFDISINRQSLRNESSLESGIHS
ncbi:MAG: hypothetical protein ACI8Y7_000197 [Candidatus Woesearchaeota archaeon]|jgi:hypothetical protein